MRRKIVVDSSIQFWIGAKKKIRCQTTNNREEEEEEVGEEEIPMHTKKNCLKAEELLNLEEQRDTREGGVEEGRR